MSDSISSSVGLYRSPDEHHELRSISPRGAKRHTSHSRLIGPDNPDPASWLTTCDQLGHGVYIALNPVRPTHPPSAAAKDADIVRRANVVVDVDPTRPADTNATDVEKAAARAVATAAREYLAGIGFPEPAVIDSGNGYHLMYRVELPNDDATRDLVKRWLNALAARFDTDAAKVDTSVFNASRVVRLPGTRNTKGPH